MKTTIRSSRFPLLAAALVAASTFAVSTPAQAGGPSVAGLLGYGFKDGTNLGLGVRGGYTLPMNVYLGGTLVYHLGTSVGPISSSLLYLGVEGGYEISAGPVVVRPFVGLGPAIGKSSGSVCAGTICVDASGSNTDFGVWPGVTVLYPLGPAFIGGDARFLIVNNYNSFAMFVTGGLTF